MVYWMRYSKKGKVGVADKRVWLRGKEGEGGCGRERGVVTGKVV